MEIGFHFGTTFDVYSNVSVISRMEGAGGYTYVPRAMYSLRMSFWMVPESAEGAVPCASPTAW
jgi:hypothetical protein